MSPRISPPAHRRGADHNGGWTQIFGGKASEPQTFRPVEKRNFVDIFCVVKLGSAPKMNKLGKIKIKTE